jgi:hypothetical protein
MRPGEGCTRSSGDIARLKRGVMLSGYQTPRNREKFWRREMGRTKKTSRWVPSAVDLSISGESTQASSNVYLQSLKLVSMAQERSLHFLIYIRPITTLHVYIASTSAISSVPKACS